MESPSLPRPRRSGIFDLERLLLALPVLAVLLLVVYLFAPWREADPSVQAAVLLDTPQIEDGSQRRVGLDVGSLAPDFEASTADGRRVRLSDLRGRPVLINFWARWCTSCLSEMPEIKALQQERGRDAFAVLAVNAGETRAQALEFIEFLDAPFIFVLDPGLVLSDAYGVHGLPLSVFVDARGVVQAVYRGHADRARLEAYISAAMEGRPAPTLPVQLRPVSTIPRERVLWVERRGPSELVFSSRSLRCDSSYCAEPAVQRFLATPGISGASFDPRETRLALRFDPSLLDESVLVQHLHALLQDLRDPVYERELEVRYR